jgi:hypothetical protein
MSCRSSRRLPGKCDGILRIIAVGVSEGSEKREEIGLRRPSAGANM